MAAFLGAQVEPGRKKGRKSTAMAPISGDRAQKGRFSPPAWSTGTDGDIVRTTLTTERSENGHRARGNRPRAWRSEQGPGWPGGREGSPLSKGTPPRRHSPDKRERVKRRCPSRLAEILYGAAAWGVMGLVAIPAGCWSWACPGPTGGGGPPGRPCIPFLLLAHPPENRGPRRRHQASHWWSWPTTRASWTPLLW